MQGTTDLTKAKLGRGSMSKTIMIRTWGAHFGYKSFTARVDGENTVFSNTDKSYGNIELVAKTTEISTNDWFPVTRTVE